MWSANKQECRRRQLVDVRNVRRKFDIIDLTNIWRTKLRFKVNHYLKAINTWPIFITYSHNNRNILHNFSDKMQNSLMMRLHLLFFFSLVVYNQYLTVSVWSNNLCNIVCKYTKWLRSMQHQRQLLQEIITCANVSSLSRDLLAY